MPWRALPEYFDGRFPLVRNITATGTAVWTFPSGHTLALSYGAGEVVHASPFWSLADRADTSIIRRVWAPDGMLYEALAEPAGLDGIRLCEPGASAECVDEVRRLTVEPDDLRGALPFTSGYVLPAWSPVTREMVIRWGNQVVYGGCLDGQPHFAVLLEPIFGDGLFVRGNGEIVVTGIRTYVLGSDGEPLRDVQVGGGTPDTQALASTFSDTCGVLFERENRRMWQWLDVDTMELGPQLRLPGGAGATPGAWSGTPDCGVIAHTDPVSGSRLVRLSPEGATVFDVAGPGLTAPFVLADGGFLTVLPGQYDVFGPDGSIQDHIGFDASFVGPCWPQSSRLAPDGTLFLACGPWEAEDGPLAFHAVPTGHPAGPELAWHGGLNFAGTNSILPE